jgi:predicted ArsR family transcriptional regulator
MTTKTEQKRMGGARPGAGRTQTTYKISVEAAKRLQTIAKHYGNRPEQLLEGLINNHFAELENTRISDEANQLLNVLTPEPQTIDTISKRLRISKSKLQTLIAQHQNDLEAQGLHLHVATHSEVAQAIKLSSQLNNQDHTYYNKLSRNLFSLAKT